MNKIYIFLLMLSICLLTGCGTFIKLANSDNFNDSERIYVATRFDLVFLWRCIVPDNNTLLGPRDAVYLSPLAVIDVPLAIILDTFQFPWDLYKYYTADKTGIDSPNKSSEKPIEKRENELK